MMNRRQFAATLCLICTGMLAGSAVAADDYPHKPIRWIVGYPAGGGSDLVARTLADRLQRSIGQPVVVENKPGATTSIAAQAVAKSEPDGYTIFSPDNGTLVNNPMLFAKLPYDPVQDFAPVTMIVKIPMLLVANPAFPAKDVKAFVDLIKKNPGKYSYASPGKGTPHHLAMELFKFKAGMEILDVPYKGGAPATQDVLSGQVPFMILDVGSATPYLKAGKLKAYAVMAGKRLNSLPDVPAISEFGFTDLDVQAWQGVVVPKQTPKPVIAKLNAELVKAIENPEVQARLRAAGMEPISSTPEQFAAQIKSEAKIWQPFLKTLNIRLD